MVESEALRWALTALLIVPIIHHLSLLRVPNPGPEARLSLVGHLLMCGSMVAMTWPWGDVVPAWPQAAIFFMAGGYFLASALRPRHHTVGEDCAPGNVRLDRLHQTVGMWAMSWMLIAMPLLHTQNGASTFMMTHAEHHGSDTRAVITVPVSPDMRTGAIVVSIGLACYLVLATAHLLITALGGSGSKLSAAAHGLMNVSMISMLVMMV